MPGVVVEVVEEEWIDVVAVGVGKGVGLVLVTDEAGYGRGFKSKVSGGEEVREDRSTNVASCSC